MNWGRSKLLRPRLALSWAIVLFLFLFLFTSPAFAACDFFGKCYDEPTKAEAKEIKPADDMPPQPEPLPALKADIKPVVPKPERAQGSIGGSIIPTKVLKTGTIGGAKPDPVCEDKGDETFCH